MLQDGTTLQKFLFFMIFKPVSLGIKAIRVIKFVLNKQGILVWSVTPGLVVRGLGYYVTKNFSFNTG
jgi:hypothetical protein